MYQAIEAIWKNRQIVPLEPLEAEDNTRLMIVVLNAEKPASTHIDEDYAARVRALRGSMRDSLSSVEEFLANKQEEIELEEGR
jgi:hypothetical protein